MTRILVPTNGSENTQKAGEYAITTAEISSDIILLYVIDTDYLGELSHADLRENLQKRLIKMGKGIINDFKKQIEDAKCQGHCKHVNLIPLIKEGKPEEVILKTIEDENIDKIIVSKSNKSTIEKYVIGSITQKVAKKAKIPVEII